MANYIRASEIEEIKRLTLEGKSLRHIASLLHINKGTVHRYRNLMLPQLGRLKCPCGELAFHRGWCSERLKHSPARQAFLARWMEGRPAAKPKIISLKHPLLNYPFAPSPVADGAAMVLLVNGLVPRGLPEQLRGDVCQELLASIFAGEFTEAEIPSHVKSIIARVRRQQEGSYMAISLDAPRRDGRSWHDVISST